MDEKRQILFMQVRILKMASEKLKLSLADTARLFKEYDVLGYIRGYYNIALAVLAHQQVAVGGLNELTVKIKDLNRRPRRFGNACALDCLRQSRKSVNI